VLSEPQVWGRPYWDNQHTEYNRKQLFGADELLLGRETYEGFAQAWPSRPSDDYVDRINSMPKRVASRTLTRRPGTRRCSAMTWPGRSRRSRSGPEETS
jgi:dihydrofolate reductase